MSDPEKENFLQAAYQKSPWLVIAVALHAIALAIMFVWVLTSEKKKVDAPPTTAQVTQAKVIEEVIQPPEEIERKAVPKNEEAELVAYENEMYVPVEEAVDPDLYLEVGDPNAVDNLPSGQTGGTSVGVGIGPGHWGAGLPSTFASRRVGSGGRKGRPGVTTGTEEAVLEGLRWLIRHQNPDGSWGANTLREICVTSAPCWPDQSGKDGEKLRPTSHYNEGLTGLALLCFLGQGLGHDSKLKITDTAMGKQYVAGEVVKKGLLWLKDKQNDDGSFTPGRAYMYNEALATLAMCEAYGLTQQRLWKDPAQRAVNFLMGAQKPSPSAGAAVDPSAAKEPTTGYTAGGLWGWRYAARQEILARKDRGEIDDAAYALELHDADTSVTTWVIMALKSAELSGLDINKGAMYGGLDFVRWATGQNGMVGYVDPQGAGLSVSGTNDHFTYHPAVMSALGMCAHAFVEHDPNNKFLELAAEQLRKDLPQVSRDKLSVDYYYWYYGTLALNQYDGPDSPRGQGMNGKYWGPWNKAMNEAVLGLQDKTETRDICNRGGWLTLDRWSYTGGPIYTTAINTLTLEVYYRYGNAFGVPKREEKVKPK